MDLGMFHQQNKYLQIYPAGTFEMQCFYLLQKFLLYFQEKS